MTATVARFGTFIVADQVEDAIVRHFKTWVGDYFPAAFETADDLPVMAPQSWSVAPVAAEEVATGPLPHVSVIAAQDVQTPEMEPNGTMNRTLGISIVSDWRAAPAFYAVSEQSNASRAAKRSAFALDALLIQHPAIHADPTDPDSPVIGVATRYLGIESFGRYTRQDLYRMTTNWEIRVEGFIAAHSGPSFPGSLDPEATVTSTHLDITKEAVA